jgi:hypothetical protein
MPFQRIGCDGKPNSIFLQVFASSGRGRRTETAVDRFCLPELRRRGPRLTYNTSSLTEDMFIAVTTLLIYEFHCFREPKFFYNTRVGLQQHGE